MSTPNDLHRAIRKGRTVRGVAAGVAVVLLIVVAAGPAGAAVQQILPPSGDPVSTTTESRDKDVYIEFLREVEVATTSIVVTTPTVPIMYEGATSPPAPTEIPDWLTGPASGTILGRSLPLSIGEAIDVGLRYNYGLQSSERDVAIAGSIYRAERYEFVPFVNLLAGYNYVDDKTGILLGSGLAKTRLSEAQAGLRVTQQFPTGGDISIENLVDRRRFRDTFRIETVDPETGRVISVDEEDVISREYENSLSVVARQPLLRGGGFSVGLAGLRQARLGRITTELTDLIRRRDLALAIIRNYFFILQRQLDARVSLDAAAEKERFLEETKLKVDLGEIAEIEIGRAEIFLLNEEDRAQRLKRAFLDSLEDLLVLMGQPLDTPLRLEESIPKIVDLADLGLADREMCVHEALANRPELLRADLNIRRAEIDLEVARNGVLPFLDLEAAYGDSETGRHLREANDLDDSRRWSLGALFDLPFPNVGQREALRRARLRLEQARLDREDLALNIAQEVHRLYRALESNRTRVEILERTVALAEVSLEQVNERFRQGEGNTTIIDVREAQDDLFENRTSYNNARLQYHADLASLYRTIGRPLYRELGSPAMTAMNSE